MSATATMVHSTVGNELLNKVDCYAKRHKGEITLDGQNWGVTFSLFALHRG
jgi:hypothetical protein